MKPFPPIRTHFLSLYIFSLFLPLTHRITIRSLFHPRNRNNFVFSLSFHRWRPQRPRRSLQRRSRQKRLRWRRSQRQRRRYRRRAVATRRRSAWRRVLRPIRSTSSRSSSRFILISAFPARPWESWTVSSMTSSRNSHRKLLDWRDTTRNLQSPQGRSRLLCALCFLVNLPNTLFLKALRLLPNLPVLRFFKQLCWGWGSRVSWGSLFFWFLVCRCNDLNCF